MNSNLEGGGRFFSDNSEKQKDYKGKIEKFKQKWEEGVKKFTSHKYRSGPIGKLYIKQMSGESLSAVDVIHYAKFYNELENDKKKKYVEDVYDLTPDIYKEFYNTENLNGEKNARDDLIRIKFKKEKDIKYIIKNNLELINDKNYLHDGLNSETKKQKNIEDRINNLIRNPKPIIEYPKNNKSKELKNPRSNTSKNETQNKTKIINKSAKLNNATPNNKIPTMNKNDQVIIENVMKKLNSNNNLENKELKLLLRKLFLRNLKRTQRFFKKIEKDLKTKKKKSEYFKLKQSVNDKYKEDVLSLGYNNYLQSTKKSINTLYSDLENKKSYYKRVFTRNKKKSKQSGNNPNKTKKNRSYNPLRRYMERTIEKVTGDATKNMINAAKNANFLKKNPNGDFEINLESQKK